MGTAVPLQYNKILVGRVKRLDRHRPYLAPRIY